MAFATATVESWTDNPCASWAEGGDQGDVKRSLCCDASGQQLWLIFFALMTVYCARIRFFEVLRNLLVSVFAEITFAIWWKLTIFRLILDKRWNWLCNLIIGYLLLLAHLGTYKYSLFLGHHATIYEISNPAFGGRGPGFYKKTHGRHNSMCIRLYSMIYHILQYNDFNVSANGFTNVTNDFISMISHVLQCKMIFM